MIQYHFKPSCFSLCTLYKCIRLVIRPCTFNSSYPSKECLLHAGLVDILTSVMHLLFVFISDAYFACFHQWCIFCLFSSVMHLLFVFISDASLVCFHQWCIFCLFSSVMHLLFVFTILMIRRIRRDFDNSFCPGCVTPASNCTMISYGELSASISELIACFYRTVLSVIQAGQRSCASWLIFCFITRLCEQCKCNIVATN